MLLAQAVLREGLHAAKTNHSGMTVLRLSLAAAFLVPITVAKASPVVLTVDAGSFSTTEVSTASGKAVRHTGFSGVVPGVIILDPITRKPSRFRFEGGSLIYGDDTSNYTPFAPPASEDLRFTSTGLMGPVSSVTGLPVVDPVTGMLGNADHFQSLSAGTLRTVYQILFFGSWITLFDQTADFATAPQMNAFTGTTSLTSELQAAGPVLERHRLVLTHVSDSSPVVFTESGVTLTSVTTGGFTARGEVLAPSAAFHSWMLSAGAEEPVSAASMLGTWPGAVLYALGLPGSARDLPWELNAAARTLTLHLPAGGTRAPLRVEYSTTLASWTPLPLPVGGAELGSGSSGTLVLTLPAGPSGFVRLALP